MRIYYPKPHVRISKKKMALPKKKGGSIAAVAAALGKPVIAKARSIRPIRFTF